MAPVDLRLRNTDLRYGTICPKCAGPKTVQAAECKRCFTERQRASDYYELRTCTCGNTKDRAAAKCRTCEADRLRGVPVHGRENRADHPWRAKRFGSQQLSLTGETG